ncbi:MAG: ATP-binding cassette domain-containing protein, partial [Candidatus Arcticimaribacter sp.]
SLLRLLAGVIEPTQGDLFVGEHNLKALQLNNYRSMLGLSLSDEAPFEGTLKENLTFGDNSISDGEIRRVMEVLGLHEFVKAQPFGLSSLINSQGKHISYTVTKKLILARAILHQPKCLILEDPLDIFTTEETQNIIDYLCDHSHPWSIVVVSNNNYWRKKCKQLIELKDGRMKISKK